MKILITILHVFITTMLFAQNGLIASYPFNGNANDVSGNGHHGAINGAILTTDRFGNSNCAYLFTGNDYINIGNISFSSHSFSAWCRKNGGTNNVLISKLNNGPHDFKNSELSLNGFLAGTGSTWESIGTTNGSVDYSQWNFIVGTYDASTSKLKVYVNGVCDSIYMSSYFDVTNSAVFIGARPYWNGASGPAFYFDGAIDDVKIFNKAINQATVDSLYLSGLTGMDEYSQNYFSVFPNPATTTLNINSLVSIEDVSVFNSMGELVLSETGSTVNIQNLSNGAYCVRINKQHIIFFIKQ